MNEFKGQVAIVTGAASGIGCAIARMLIEREVKVALLDINRKELENEFVESDKVSLCVVDITSEPMIKETVSKVFMKYGQINILINCAGITGITNVLSHNVSIEDLRKVFEVNFMSCFYTTKAVIPYMLEKNYGRILHVASIAGKEGNAGMLAYSASKAAVIGMTKVQGKEYAETGITVNALAPGVIRTKLVDDMPEKQVDYMLQKIPMKRCGTLVEATNLVAFIVSEKNKFTTGFTYDLSGGRATY